MDDDDDDDTGPKILSKKEKEKLKKEREKVSTVLSIRWRSYLIPMINLPRQRKRLKPQPRKVHKETLRRLRQPLLLNLSPLLKRSQTTRKTVTMALQAAGELRQRRRRKRRQRKMKNPHPRQLPLRRRLRQESVL